MAFSRPSTANNRPAYLDKLFSGNPPPPLPSHHASNPSLRSASSSVSFSSSSTMDTRNLQPTPKLCSAFDDDDDHTDRISIRSLKFHLSPRFKLRNPFSKRAHPRIQETVQYASAKPITSHGELVTPRRPSLPKLQTDFSSPTRKGHAHSPKFLPFEPQPVIDELPCQRCYYFFARNCNGYVLGGGHGDACEGCAVCSETSINMTSSG